MNNLRCAACLDIGGTTVKSGVVTEDGKLIAGTTSQAPVNSKGSIEEILSTFAQSLGKVLKYANECENTLGGIGIAMPGPFDYERGISYIKDLDKYESIYGVNVKQELQQRLKLPSEFPLVFDVDSWSFARGEVWFGAGNPYSRVIVFTMGTGVGSAFAVNKRIVDEGPGLPPWLGCISLQPYKKSVLNDYISRTYMMKHYEELTGKTIDIEEMADRAKTGEVEAILVFEEIGSVLGQFLKRHNVEEFGAECVLFGGQISKSIDLFIGPIREALSDIKSLKVILQATDIEHSALKGVAKHVFDAEPNR